MNDTNYFSYLYDIASHLNKEFSLHSALRKSLEKTAEILHVETGWIWLTEANNKSVYLAASHNLPPALSKHPERLSGWCYCINQYFSDDINQAMNISEMVCSRLKDVKSGTNDLKFHATIPIIIEGQKVGLINLLSKETRKLNEKELTILNTISQLVGTAIQRTRIQPIIKNDSQMSIQRVSEAVLFPQLNEIISSLESSQNDRAKVNDVLQKTLELKKDFNSLLKETEALAKNDKEAKEFQYPQSPITKRELEVLNLIKKGLTNDEIGKQLFITERTVKFHITAILSKLNANNRTEAVDIGFKRGFFNL